MADRRPSSRDSQGDRLPNRSRQDSSPHRSRHNSLIGLGIDKNTYDQQASTSSGLNNEIRDKLQKRFNIFLDEYKICLHNTFNYREEEQNAALEKYKQEFQKANGNEKEQYINNLEDYIRKIQPDKYDNDKQVEIDKKLGYLLKSKDANGEELRNIRMHVLKFIEQKIEDAIDKKEMFLHWSNTIDEYCGNHDQLITSNIYANVSKDMYLCYNPNRLTIETCKEHDNYKNKNRTVYEIIKRINESVYPRVERDQFLTHENRELARQDSQDLRAQLGTAGIREQHILFEQLSNNWQTQHERRNNRHNQYRQLTPEQRHEQQRGRDLRHEQPQPRRDLRHEQTQPGRDLRHENHRTRNFENMAIQLFQQIHEQSRHLTRIQRSLRRLFRILADISPRQQEPRRNRQIQQNHEQRLDRSRQRTPEQGRDLPNLAAMNVERINQYTHDLNQRMQEHLNQQRSRRPLERIREEARQLDRHMQWMLGETLIVSNMPIMESVQQRAIHIQNSIDNRLRQNRSTGTQA